MDDQEFELLFGLTAQDKQDLINAIADGTVNALDDDNAGLECQDETL